MRIPADTTRFDENKAYSVQGDVFFDDGREIELLHFVYNHPKINEIRGSPSGVLKAIDEYARTKKYLMNVGEDKGQIVTEVILETKPKTMVELGGYVGYSCILFGDALRLAGGERYFSLERNPEFAAVISSLVDLAGLSSLVKVIVGPSDVSLRRLHAEGQLTQIDFMFLDHYKPAYTPDLKLCEQLQLIRPGSHIAADNVVKPGNPPYVEYVRSTPAEKRARSMEGKGMEGKGMEGKGMEGFAEGTARQYVKRQGEEKLDLEIRGDPDLVYLSRLVNSYEPTGIPDGLELSKCIRREE